MAVHQPKRKPTPAERCIADRIQRAKRANPPRNGVWYERCSELAKQLGLDAGDVMDDFDYRASIRQYDAGMTRDEAERLGFNDVVEQYDPRRKLP